MAFNRVRSLQRLLESIQNSGLPNSRVDIEISLDKGYRKEVKKVVSDLVWPSGIVTLVEQERHLGLNEHVFHLFEAAAQMADDTPIIFLEDDTMALQGLDKLIFYQLEMLQNEPSLFSASFYNYYRNEELGIPFIPLQTGAPVYVMQKVSSRGWMSTSKRIRVFLEWKKQYRGDFSVLPGYMAKWEKNAWEKWVNTYLIEQGYYSLFPYFSATTGFGELGDHYRTEVHRFLAQTPFHPMSSMNFNQDLDAVDLVHYDAFYEVDPEYLKKNSIQIENWPESFDVDLYGTKRQADLKFAFTLTSRFRQNQSYSLSFGMDLLPVEQNILLNNPGDEIRMIRSSDLPLQSKRQHHLQRYKFRLHSHTYQTIMDGIRMKIARIFS